MPLLVFYVIYPLSILLQYTHVLLKNCEMTLRHLVLTMSFTAKWKYSEENDRFQALCNVTFKQRDHCHAIVHICTGTNIVQHLLQLQLTISRQYPEIGPIVFKIGCKHLSIRLHPIFVGVMVLSVKRHRLVSRTMPGNGIV